jgi:hypothetical protein
MKITASAPAFGQLMFDPILVRLNTGLDEFTSLRTAYANNAFNCPAAAK